MPTYQDQLLSGEFLEPSSAIVSENGGFTLLYQGDGNLVLYQNDPYLDRTALWASGTDGSEAGRCIMQGDGNLVIYDPHGAPVWDTGTFSNPGSRLIVQGDGNVVIYRPEDVAIWATDTVRPLLVSPLPTNDLGFGHMYLNQNADGRLEVFANVFGSAHTEGAWVPHHAWQIFPNGPWSDWTPFPENPSATIFSIG